MRYEPSNVSSKYGAPMGRQSYGAHDPSKGTPRLSLQRVRIDRGGYDSGGAYWGLGEPLYVATDGDGIEVFVRGATRNLAKQAVRARLAFPVEFLR